MDEQSTKRQNHPYPRPPQFRPLSTRLFQQFVEERSRQINADLRTASPFDDGNIEREGVALNKKRRKKSNIKINLNDIDLIVNLR